MNEKYTHMLEAIRFCENFISLLPHYVYLRNPPRSRHFSRITQTLIPYEWHHGIITHENATYTPYGASPSWLCSGRGITRRRASWILQKVMTERIRRGSLGMSRLSSSLCPLREDGTFRHCDRDADPSARRRSESCESPYRLAQRTISECHLRHGRSDACIRDIRRENPQCHTGKRYIPRAREHSFTSPDGDALCSRECGKTPRRRNGK